MSYDKQEWESGDLITEEKLDHIEEGVRSVNSGYEPTDWTSGDVITAERLNHIEDGIENAQGGIDPDGLFNAKCTIRNATTNVGIACSHTTLYHNQTTDTDTVRMSPTTLAPQAETTIDIMGGINYLYFGGGQNYVFSDLSANVVVANNGDPVTFGTTGYCIVRVTGSKSSPRSFTIDVAS